MHKAAGRTRDKQITTASNISYPFMLLLCQTVIL